MWNGDVEAAEWHNERKRFLLDEVLARDPGHSAGNATWAWEAFSIPDLPLAAKYTERALESEPTNFGAITTAGEVLVRLGRAEQAIPILRYATERDPLSSYHFDNLAGAYMSAGQYELAEEAYRVQLVLEPDNDNWTGWGIGLALLLQGKANEALQYFDENMDDMPLRWHGKTLALNDLGRTDDARSELDKLLEVDPGTPIIHWLIGTAYAWIGETDKAFASFEKQREQGSMVFTSVGDSPLYANLPDDPRWQPFLASVGRDPDFLASVEFNPTFPSEIR
jgi:tetratricopeptide (TPR) repeat protein